METEERVVLVAQLQDELSAPLQQAEQALEGVARATDQARDSQGRFARAVDELATASRTSSTAQGAMAAATERVAQSSGRARDENGRFASTTERVTQASGQLAAAQGQLATATGHTVDAAGRLRDANGRYVTGAGQVNAATQSNERSLSLFDRTLGRVGARIPDAISRPFQAAGRDVGSATTSMVSAVGSSLSRIGGMAASAGKSLAAGIGNGAKEASKAVGMIGAAVVGTGVAFAATAAKAGLAANVLGQTSRASLKTLLGSTEAASAQMAKLDEFASKSPFDKSVFINAQRQMIGFGIETGKVLPVLGSIQDAVAAVGGTNDDISSIATTFAKIQSAGKLTGDDLQSLGSYGINAAELLANEFGTTAESIKKDISSGAIGAEKAIDGLSAAMDKKFGGAAAGVKDTWVGAMDRIGSARRDLGKAMMEPFVSEEEGKGMAIPWANSLADIIRNFIPLVAALSEAFANKIAPAVDFVLGRIKVLTSAFKMDGAPQAIIALLNGEFTPALRNAFHIEEDHGIVRLIQGIRSGLESIKPLLGPIIGAVVAFGGGALAGLLGPFGKFIPVLNPVLGIILGLIAASPDLRDALGGAFESLMPVFETLFGALQPVVEAVGSFAGVLGGVLAQVVPIVADLIGSLLGTVAGLIPVLLPVVEAVLGVAAVLLSALVPILPVVSTLITTLVGVVAGLIPVLMPIIMLVVDLASKLIGALMPVIPPIIGIFTELVTMIAGLLVPILTALLPPIMGVIEALFPLLPAVTDIIMIFVELISAVLTPLMPLVTMVAGLITTVLVAALNILMPVVQLLVGAFTSLVSYLKGPLGDAINFISGLFTGLMGFISPVVDAISKVVGAVGGGIGGALSGIGDLFGFSGGGVVGFAGGGVLQAAGGSVLGGYAPGMDTVAAMLSPGESVLVPEATKAIGPGNILAINHAFSGGRAPGSTGGHARAQLPAPRPTPALVSSGPDGGGRGGDIITISPTIYIQTQPGQSEEAIGDIVVEKLEQAFASAGRRSY